MGAAPQLGAVPALPAAGQGCGSLGTTAHHRGSGGPGGFRAALSRWRISHALGLIYARSTVV